MTDIYPPTVQRPALLAFAEACATRANCLRRDECSDWAIFGNNGHIYAVPEGFQLMIGCAFEPRWSSARGWTEAKRRLAFGKVTRDGDEGRCDHTRTPANPGRGHTDKTRSRHSQAGRGCVGSSLESAGRTAFSGQNGCGGITS
jgi:hypothetical protein